MRKLVWLWSKWVWSLRAMDGLEKLGFILLLKRISQAFQRYQYLGDFGEYLKLWENLICQQSSVYFLTEFVCCFADMEHIWISRKMRAQAAFAKVVAKMPNRQGKVKPSNAACIIHVKFSSAVLRHIVRLVQNWHAICTIYITMKYRIFPTSRSSKSHIYYWLSHDRGEAVRVCVCVYRMDLRAHMFVEMVSLLLPTYITWTYHE